MTPQRAFSRTRDFPAAILLNELALYQGGRTGNLLFRMNLYKKDVFFARPTPLMNIKVLTLDILMFSIVRKNILSSPFDTIFLNLNFILILRHKIEIEKVYLIKQNFYDKFCLSLLTKFLEFVKYKNRGF